MTKPVGVGVPVEPLIETVTERVWAVVMLDTDGVTVIFGVACCAVKATKLEVLAE
jgi:hypothetical protein